MNIHKGQLVTQHSSKCFLKTCEYQTETQNSLFPFTIFDFIVRVTPLRVFHENYLFDSHNMLPKTVIGLRSFIQWLLRNSLTSVLFVSCCRWSARIYQWRPGRRFDRDSSPWNPITFVRSRKSFRCGISALRYFYNADIWRTRFWKICKHIQSDVRNANTKGIQKQRKR